MLYPASLNEMPAPDAVSVFIKISYKIFYNRFRVIGVNTIAMCTYLGENLMACVIFKTDNP